jgi:hypothetical protein
MNNIQSRSIAIFAALAALMAATRYNHFGSSVALPDASLAVFFLGGLYLSRFARMSVAAFSVLIIEAGLVDCYATSVQGVSNWCMTPAYWFLIPTYGSLWLVGRWFARRHMTMDYTFEGKKLFVLILAAWVANSFAFVFSNATFYLFSERFNEMSAAEYASRVSQYYGSYVSVALLYIACAVALHIASDMVGKHRAHIPSDAA